MTEKQATNRKKNRMSLDFINPRNDYAFRRIFGDQKHSAILISFLNAVLHFPAGRRVQQVELLDPRQTPGSKELKETVVDIRATDERGRQFIVEMQLEQQRHFDRRAIYYSAKAYTGQIGRPSDFDLLQPAYFIGVLDFEAIAGAHWLTSWRFQSNETTDDRFMNWLTFCFIELPKFDKQEDELTGVVEKWGYFLKNIGGIMDEQKDYQRIFKGEPALLEALELARMDGLTREERMLYEAAGGSPTVGSADPLHGAHRGRRNRFGAGAC